MRFTAMVTVKLKAGVLDPQGAAVRSALTGLGYTDVAEVAVGRHITLDLEAASVVEAESQVAEIARRILANPVLETFAVDLREVV
ncbi:MAG: phosphoribosylformylglycinamidine synthase subunit PurS [Symbiobacteriia bacterium]